MKKIKFSTILMFFIVMFLFGFISNVNALIEAEIISELSTAEYSEKIERIYINGKGATTFYYDNDISLNSYGEYLYNQFYAFIKDNHYEAHFVIKEGPLNEYLDQIGIAYQAFVRDHLEFFWLTEGYTTSYKYNENLLGEKTITELTLIPTISETYIGDEDLLTDDIDKYIIQVEMLVEESKDYLYNYEKVKFFHDWLVLNNDYSEESEDLAHSSIGALLNKYSPVCEGYAKAFMILCNYINIGNIVATGEAGEKHAWNYVEIFGEWYFTDVTWDDPITNPNDPSNIEYTYFLSVIDDEHILDEEQILPIPLATKRFDKDSIGNYYIVNFYDGNDKIYFTNEVKEGEKSLEPFVLPVKDGYKYIEWDQEYDNVLENLDIKPIFDKANIIVKDAEGANIVIDYESIEDILSIDLNIDDNLLFIGWSDGNKYYSSTSIITEDVVIVPVVKEVVFTIKGMKKIDDSHFTIPLFNIENLEIDVEEGVIVKTIEKPEINVFTDEYEIEITFGSNFSNSTITKKITITATGMKIINDVINWIKINYIYLLVGVGGIIVIGMVNNSIKKRKRK
ncbi:MAG: hypothetical protein PHT90_01725 [Bacilli bacterium]|nr:hypothetical protein [Bacilli bacterium]